MLESLALSWHITRRNWRVYTKDFFSNISPTMVEPAFYLLALGVGLGAYVQDVDGKTYIQYLAPGLVISTALFTSFFESSYGFYVRMAYENIFKAMLTTPIGVKEIVIGELIWNGIKAALMCFSMSLVLMAFGLFKEPALILFVPVIGFLVSLPCAAMGLLASALVSNINKFQIIYSLIIAPLFFFSGIFYPVPESLRIVSYLSPINHGVELSQAIFWNQDWPRAFVIHGSILLIQGLLLCYWAYIKVRKKLTS